MNNMISKHVCMFFFVYIGSVFIYSQSNDKAMTVVRLQILIFHILPSIITT